MKRANIKISLLVPVTLSILVEGDDDTINILALRAADAVTVSPRMIEENMTDDDRDLLRSKFNDAVYG